MRISVIVSLAVAPAPPGDRFSAVDLAALLDRVETGGKEVLSAIPQGEFELIRRYRAVPALAGGATAAGVAALAAHPRVAHVALNYEVHADLAEAMPLIRADDAHDLLGVTGAGVVVAVLDTGIDTDHPLLMNHINHQKCFLDAGTCPGGGTTGPSAEDGAGHGSHVSGIITPTGPPVAITPDGTKAVVGHEGNVRLVSVIDVASRSIDKTISVGADLWNGTIAINPSGTKAVVSLLNDARVVNLVTDAVSGNLATACCTRLRVTADGQYVFAGGFRGSLISFDTETIVADLNNVLSASVVATSPAGPRAAEGANHFGEELLVFNTNGAAGFLEDIVPSGPPPEGDKARTVAISPDGSTAVVVNILSDNATIVDLPNRLVKGVVAVGDRPSEVEITPDGSKAVVANLDSSFVSVIDLQTQAVTNINISRRGSQVRIAPDGSYAYVAVVADGDGVWRIDLNSLTVAGPKILTGNMGGIGFLFSQASGMTPSHDGATLVTANSFDNSISLIDTASWTEVARVPVGSFPVRAAFSPDDAEIYVSNSSSDTVSVVSNTGAGSAVTGAISVGDAPFELVVASDGSKLFVADSSVFGHARIAVVDLPGTTVTKTIALTGSLAGLHIDPLGQELYAAVATTLGGVFFVIDAQAETVLAQIDTGLPPAMLAFHNSNPLAVIPSPFGDGVTLIDLGPTAPPVGGIAELPEVAGVALEKPDSSGPNVGVLASVAAAVAAGALALSGAAWYVRRRW